MESRQEKTSSASNKSSFFGLPAGWSKVGPMFWGGVIFGIGIGVGLGLLIGAELVGKGMITPQNNGRLVVTALVLQLIGIVSGRAIAARAIRRSQHTDG